MNPQSFPKKNELTIHSNNYNIFCLKFVVPNENYLHQSYIVSLSLSPCPFACRADKKKALRASPPNTGKHLFSLNLAADSVATHTPPVSMVPFCSGHFNPLKLLFLLWIWTMTTYFTTRPER
jgi:hypothetical protein